LQPPVPPSEDEEDDDFAEFNESTASSTFLDRRWFRWAGFLFAALVVISFGLPVLAPFVRGSNDPNRSDTEANDSAAVPDFLLPNAFGGQVKLSDLTNRNTSVVLIFYGGLDCATCREQIVDLQQSYAAIRGQDAELVAVSVDSVADARRMADLAQASFPILSDESQTVSKNYFVYDYLGDGAAASTTLIIDTDLNIVAAGNPGVIVPASAILNSLRELNGDVGGTSS
jgi:peroxiredoxin